MRYNYSSSGFELRYLNSLDWSCCTVHLNLIEWLVGWFKFIISSFAHSDASLSLHSPLVCKAETEHSLCHRQVLFSSLLQIFVSKRFFPQRFFGHQCSRYGSRHDLYYMVACIWFRDPGITMPFNVSLPRGVAVYIHHALDLWDSLFPRNDGSNVHRRLRIHRNTLLPGLHRRHLLL